MPTPTRQLRQRNRELTVLNEIAHELNESVGLDQALEAALRKVAALLDLSTSWIWLLSEETGEPYLAAAQNLPPRVCTTTRSKWADGVTAWTRTGRVI